MMKQIILFLCTGNYYRSRFAEELFNHLAAARDLPWQATSRALAIEKGKWNIGPISPHALAALQARNIPPADPSRHPIGCRESDMAAATRIIALKEAEHRPYIAQRLPAWADRVEYWHVHDLDRATADEALPEIEHLVRGLMDSLPIDRQVLLPRTGATNVE
jgi:protein-tyrosine phosphatase